MIILLFLAMTLLACSVYQIKTLNSSYQMIKL